MIIKSDSISVGVKVIAECYQASSMATFHGQESYAEPWFKSGLARTSQMECENGLLLQGRVLRHYYVAGVGTKRQLFEVGQP